LRERVVSIWVVFRNNLTYFATPFLTFLIENIVFFKEVKKEHFLLKPHVYEGVFLESSVLFASGAKSIPKRLKTVPKMKSFLVWLKTFVDFFVNNHIF